MCGGFESRGSCSAVFLVGERSPRENNVLCVLSELSDVVVFVFAGGERKLGMLSRKSPGRVIAKLTRAQCQIERWR